ncbi:MAG: TIGR01777 family oxidoreductase [Bacteroidales bacterium]|nr:TIGR01777 family oxidoreductase [Bacteroidales bacterium]
MTKVLITGGTGLIGQKLCLLLVQKGYEVGVLTRSRAKSIIPDVNSYFWDTNSGEIDREAINTSDYIIHLAGANIGDKRWTPGRKKQISDSRTKSAELIFKNLDKGNHKLKAFISASAIGYYGAITTDKLFVETDPPANDFLGNICRKWEEGANQFSEFGIRVVNIRTGIVLTKKGGALSKFITPASLGLGSAIGSGKQFMPWIHIEDLCSIYLYAIENNDIRGPYNAVAPDHISNSELASMISRIMKKRYCMPALPALIIKILFGEMSVMILNGSMVASEKIEAAGFRFKYPGINSALESLIIK